MKALDLFSCIGCHALGFNRANIQTTAFCELKPERRAVLQVRFPGALIYDDIKTFNTKEAADIVIGGPPCKNTSVAAAILGTRTGKSLWSQMLRVGLDVGAEWIVVEQPPGNAKWEAKAGRDLSRNGYHVGRLEFGANDVGAPYIRRRVFLVACTSRPRLEVAWSAIPSAIDSVKRAADARGDWDPRKLRAISVDARSAGEMDGSVKSQERKDRIEALGDSNPPHMAEVIGRMINQRRK